MADRTPLILIPGLNCTEALWESQIDSLGGIADITVAKVHLDATMDEIADRILAEAPPRFAAAGLSMGGYVIFALLRKAPERLSAIALLDTSAFADTEKVRGIRDRQIATVEAGGFMDVVDSLWPFLVHENRQDDTELKEIVHKMARAIGPEAFIRQLRCLKERPDSRPDLNKIIIPVSIIVGEGDRLTPVAASQEMAALIPDAALHIVADCGHLSTLEKPDAINLLLKDWISAIR